MSRIASVIIVFVAALNLLAGAAALQGDDKKSNKSEAPPRLAPYVHSVIVYLKKDAPADAADKIIADVHKLLARIPSVRGIQVGRPAENATPEVSKNDYTVGLLVLFDNADGLKEYLDHRLHKEFVDKHLQSVDKIVVYDFVATGK